ncbi:UNVERIFIED_CONTAM: hypothetical protein Slati_2945900 [Sesamum latifolium]|uniref:Reverse transcriptase domain-containing protein n=1 Tax=Sesamum latifolium TaxID=2727402 RepID=A0AAW2VH96_9LAMI
MEQQERDRTKERLKPMAEDTMGLSAKNQGDGGEISGSGHVGQNLPLSRNRVHGHVSNRGPTIGDGITIGDISTTALRPMVHTWAEVHQPSPTPSKNILLEYADETEHGINTKPNSRDEPRPKIEYPAIPEPINKTKPTEITKRSENLQPNNTNKPSDKLQLINVIEPSLGDREGDRYCNPIQVDALISTEGHSEESSPVNKELGSSKLLIRREERLEGASVPWAGQGRTVAEGDRKRKRGMVVGEQLLKKPSIMGAAKQSVVFVASAGINECFAMELSRFGVCFDSSEVRRTCSPVGTSVDEELAANWRFTGFYGEPDTSCRRDVWDRLIRLSRQSDALWLCAGDFNEILLQQEKTGVLRQVGQMEDFRRALLQSDLCDLGFRGVKYTWCNRRQAPDTVWARLDRGCGNPSWCEHHPDTLIAHEAIPYSDHKSIGGRELLKWKQLSKTHWLRDGDSNTQFLHSRAANRRRHNTIARLRDEKGVWRDRDVDIQGILLRYFRDIFTLSGPLDAELNEVLSLVKPRVTPEMNQVLASPFTATEVKQAFFGMFPFKSPGPDGMPRSSFRNSGPLLCDKTETVSQLRPISLCNVIVKAASKCVANRLKPMLDSILSQSQSAFIQEAFSCLIQDAEDRGLIKGIAVARQAPQVSHLLFADDTLVFCEATEAQVNELRRILRVYALASGQEINLQKSSIVVSGRMPGVVKRFLGAMMGVRLVPQHDKYLGLPAMGGRSRQMLFKTFGIGFGIG